MYGVSTKADRCTVTISKVTDYNGNALRKLLLLLPQIKGWPADFCFTSLQVNTGRTKPHVDKANVCVSITVSFGLLTGGFLKMSDEYHDTHMKPLIVYGTLLNAATTV